MNSWNGLDFFIFLIFFANTMLGISRGASKEIISFMCLSVALIFMIKFTIPLADFFNNSAAFQDVIASEIMQSFMRAIGAGTITVALLKQITYSISLLICFASIFCVCEAVLSFSGFMELISFPYATLNRKVAGALGAVRGYVFSVILIVMLNHLFVSNPIRGSFFMSLFNSSASLFDSVIASQNPERYQELYKDKNLYNVKDIYNVVAPPKESELIPPGNETTTTQPNTN